jgi:membrane fusion protein, multidrug efflux system
MSDTPGTTDEAVQAPARPDAARGNGAGKDGPPTPGAEQPAETGAPAADGANGKKGPPWLRPALWGAGIVALIVGVIWGVNYWHFASTHVSTDDAYVTGNLVNVSPVISGTLAELTVDEGSVVRRGQLIARLDDAGPQATLRQARANYTAAMSQVPQAERNLLYQEQATRAAIQKAQAALGSQRAKAAGAEQQVTLASGTTRNQVRQAQSQLSAARALEQQSLAQAHAADVAVDNYRQAVQTALASADNYQQQVSTAQKALQAAQARVQAAQTEADRTAKDETRYRVLYVQDAVSAQVYDNAKAQARNAQANVAATQSQADEAASQVEQARAGARQAQSQVEQARKNVTQAQAQARAAHRAAEATGEQVSVAQAGLGLARANSTQVGIQQANLLSASQQTGESQADVEAARAGEQQVAMRRTQISTYRAQAQQALAALNNAQITLSDTRIYAPNDGKVVRKIANVGVSLSPGQAIVTITQGNYVWVQANFKETQLKDVRPGETAEVEVDAAPGKVFKGRVRSIDEATGAATSLLPPDNSTGNFTKVVQRIPVRIELVPADSSDDKKFARAEDIANLRQGMSVTATVDIGSRDQANEKSSAGSGLSTGEPGAQGPSPGGSAAPTGIGGASGASGVPTSASGSGGSAAASGALGGTTQTEPSVGGAAGQSSARLPSTPAPPANSLPNPGMGSAASPNSGQPSPSAGGTVNNGPGMSPPASNPRSRTGSGAAGTQNGGAVAPGVQAPGSQAPGGAGFAPSSPAVGVESGAAGGGPGGSPPGGQNGAGGPGSATGAGTGGGR